MSFQNFKKILITLASLVSYIITAAQNPFSGLEHLFTEPRHYVIHRAIDPIKVDGSLTETIWSKAKWSEAFLDIEGEDKPLPALKTRIKMLWDTSYLYIGAEIIDPHIWSKRKSAEEIVYKDKVFKIFLDPDGNMHDYFEIQINPQNDPLFLLMNKPYRDGGSPITGWKPGVIYSSVKVLGSINNPRDRDTSWNIEIALPFTSFNSGKRPENNSFWRINFLRTHFDFAIHENGYEKAVNSVGQVLPARFSSWTSQGLINMQYPERWGYAVFSEADAGAKSKDFILSYSEKQKKYLWLIYYRQKAWYLKNKMYTMSLNSLGIAENYIIDGIQNKLMIDAAKSQFLASISDGNEISSVSINEEGLIRNN